MGYNFGVGREAPQFSLPSIDGDTIGLRQYRGDWFPIVVFFADPTAAAADLKGLTQRADELWGYRGQLLGVFAADVDALREQSQAAGGAGFPLLADADGAVARSYGVWDEHAGRPRNHAVIVDRAGKIVWAADGGAAAVKATEIVAAFRAIAR